jgi:outer membrane protein
MRPRRAAKTILIAAIIAVTALGAKEAYAFWWLWQQPGKSDVQKKPSQASLVQTALKTEAKPMTLEEAYRLSIKRSEDIGIKAEAINEAQAYFYQALNVSAPQVSFVMSRMYQDVSSDSSGSLGVLNRPSTPQKQFTFSQPLFTGFKSMAGIQGAGALKSQRENEWLRAKQLLLIDVMDAFYNCLLTRKEIDNLNKIRKILEDRILELKDRIRLGRSRESEMQSALTDIKQVEAGLMEVKRLETISRQILEFYIGQPIGGALIEDAHSDESADILSFLNKVETRPDVRAAREAALLAEKNMIVAQSGFFPTISVDGNYYTQRVGSQSGNDWDVTLNFSVPIFEGTKTIGDVKLAWAQRNEQYLALSKTQRQAVLDVKNSFESYRASVEADKAYYEANEAAKENYRLNSEDFKLNLISNLDILDILRRYHEIMRQLDIAHFSSKRNYWKLKVASGEAL